MLSINKNCENQLLIFFNPIQEKKLLGLCQSLEPKN